MYRFLFNILLNCFLLDFWDADFKSVLSKNTGSLLDSAEGCSQAQREH